MNEVLERILQIGMGDFKFITENNPPNLTGRKLLLKDYLDYDLSVLKEIIDDSRDCQLVKQCEKYLEAAASRPNKWDDIKKKLVEREAEIEKEPKTAEEALSMVRRAENVAFQEQAAPTPVRPSLYELVDLYITHGNNNPEFEAFKVLNDVHGRTNFYGCNHTIKGMVAVCKKDDFLVCPVCNKTVSLKMIKDFIANNTKFLGGE